MVDAISCVFSGLIGTSTSGAYIESATGIREGARTGLAAIMTALLFALSMFFIPLIEPLQMLRFAYAPALMAVGTLMVASFAKIDYEDATELIPAFATIAMMVFTYNIANGLTAGLILYPLMKLFDRPLQRVECRSNRARRPLPDLLHLWPGPLILPRRTRGHREKIELELRLCVLCVLCGKERSSAARFWRPGRFHI